MCYDRKQGKKYAVTILNTSDYYNITDIIQPYVAKSVRSSNKITLINTHRVVI